MPIRCKLERGALAHDGRICALACYHGRLEEVYLEAHDAWVRVDQLRATDGEAFFVARPYNAEIESPQSDEWLYGVTERILLTVLE
jgi:hypothetical protein